MAINSRTLTSEILADVVRISSAWLDLGQEIRDVLGVEQFVDETIGREISLDERHLLIKTITAMDALGRASLGRDRYAIKGDRTQGRISKEARVGAAFPIG